MSSQEIYDFIVVGSGFGGSISAMRLAQKGYRVAILEEGLHWDEKNFPRTNWNLRQYLWFPFLRFFGFQSLSFLKNLMVLHGKGVGGGSLVYANTLMKPSTDVLKNENWPADVRWDIELEEAYQKAQKMLGVRTNTMMYDAEKILQKTAMHLGVESTFHPTEIGVFQGEPGVEVPDPYFGGEGPPRSGCVACGGCMVGCRYNAKNMLTKNYLWFAQKYTAKIFAETKVTRIEKTVEGYQIHTQKTKSWAKEKGTTFCGKKVILAAGVLGTVKILLQNRDEYKTLPRISSMLGKEVRTNGESLLGVASLSSKTDYAKGVAIGAAIHPDEHTKIETVKYPSGSSFMRVLATPLTPAGTGITRPLKMVYYFFYDFLNHLRLFFLKDWAKQSIIILVMQNIDSKIELFLKSKRLIGKPTDQPSPSFIPIAQQTAKYMAKLISGVPQNSITEVLSMPTTAHILGGACLADSADRGVIDSKHEVFGYPGLYVCDGSAIPVNLGVNPSLTISALAERFAEQFDSR